MEDEGAAGAKLWMTLGEKEGDGAVDAPGVACREDDAASHADADAAVPHADTIAAGGRAMAGAQADKADEAEDEVEAATAVLSIEGDDGTDRTFAVFAAGPVFLPCGTGAPPAPAPGAPAIRGLGGSLLDGVDKAGGVAEEPGCLLLLLLPPPPTPLELTVFPCM